MLHIMTKFHLYEALCFHTCTTMQTILAPTSQLNLYESDKLITHPRGSQLSLSLFFWLKFPVTSAREAVTSFVSAPLSKFLWNPSNKYRGIRFVRSTLTKIQLEHTAIDLIENVHSFLFNVTLFFFVHQASPLTFPNSTAPGIFN